MNNKPKHENKLVTDEDKKRFEEMAQMMKAVRDGDEPCPMCQRYNDQENQLGVKVYRAPCIICGR